MDTHDTTRQAARSIMQSCVFMPDHKQQNTQQQHAVIVFMLPDQPVFM